MRLRFQPPCSCSSFRPTIVRSVAIGSHKRSIALIAAKLASRASACTLAQEQRFEGGGPVGSTGERRYDTSYAAEPTS
jgi:hypothetical protein